MFAIGQNVITRPCAGWDAGPRVFCIRISSPIISITSVATSGPGVAAAARGHTRPPTASVPGLSKLAPALFVFLFPVTELVYPDPVHCRPGIPATPHSQSFSRTKQVCDATKDIYMNFSTVWLVEFSIAAIEIEGRPTYYKIHPLIFHIPYHSLCNTQSPSDIKWLTDNI